MSKIRISYIVTVYNKAKFIEETIKSLISQNGEFYKEYIFIDDNSTDNTVEIIEKFSQKNNNIKLIKNNDNKGPSIRLNQAVKRATGQYLQFIDGDDLLTKGASTNMLKLLQNNQADLIYGKWQKCENTEKQSNPNSIQDNNFFSPLNYKISNKPLNYILKKGGFVRMTLMCTKKLFSTAQGCDEAIFIQDESLPIRLASHSKRFIDLRNVVVLVPAEEGKGRNKHRRLSANLAQQHHDRFYAYYNFLGYNENRTQEIGTLIYQKCISSGWKYKKTYSLFPYLSKAFFIYLGSKLLKTQFNRNNLIYLKKMFDKVQNIRRVI